LNYNKISKYNTYCFNLASTTMNIWRYKVPCLLILGIRWRWVVSFMPPPPASTNMTGTGQK